MKLVLTYKDFSSIPGVSHIGLGVTALNAAKVLGQAGVNVVTWPVFDGYVLRDKLSKDPDVTHVVMLAPWIDTPFLRSLTLAFPAVQFTVTCHSNVGFLQADKYAMKLVREQIELECDRRNFRISGNCQTYCRWITSAYNAPCVFLPNLYFVGQPPSSKPLFNGGTLRLGIFGATRQLKNIGTATAAAVVMAGSLNVDTEIWVSGGREEGGKGILDSCREMIADLPRVRMVESFWQSWPRFRQTAGHMDLMLQPSFTESFNNVTADGISQGVASAVSSAIEWVPKDWQADADDPVDLAETGLRLLRDRKAPARGLNALLSYNREGLRSWLAYLDS